MPTGRQAELTGIVKPDLDEQRLDRETSKVQQALDESSTLSPDINTRQIRRKIERAIPGGDIIGGGIDRLTGRGGPTGATGGGVMDGGLQAAQLERLTDIHEELEKIGASGGFVGGGSPAGTGGGGSIFDNILAFLAGRGTMGLNVPGWLTRGIGAAGAAGTALTMPDILGKNLNEQGTNVGPIAEFLNEWGMENSLDLGDDIQGFFSGPSVGVSDITDTGWDFGVETPDEPNWLSQLENPPWADTAPPWIDSLTQTPGWMQNAPPWFREMAGGDSAASESARAAVTEFTEIGIGLGGGVTSPIGAGINTAFEQFEQQDETTAAEAMSYQPDDPDLDGMTNAQSAAAAMAYTDGHTNRAKEKRSRERGGQVEVSSKISVRDDRDLDRKLEDVKREMKQEIKNELLGRPGGVL